MKSLLPLVLLAAALLTGCAGLPKPKPDQGALYIPFAVQELDGLPIIYLAQPELQRLDEQGLVAVQVPPQSLKRRTNHLLVTGLPAGQYQLARVAWQVDDQDQPWQAVGDQGGIRLYQEFSLEPGQLQVLPMQAWLAAERSSRRDGRFVWGAEPLSTLELAILYQDIKDKRRAELWQLASDFTAYEPKVLQATEPAVEPVPSAEPAPARLRRVTDLSGDAQALGRLLERKHGRLSSDQLTLLANADDEQLNLWAEQYPDSQSLEALLGL